MNKSDPIVLIENQNNEIQKLKGVISTLERRIRLLETRLRSVDANTRKNASDVATVTRVLTKGR